MNEDGLKESLIQMLGGGEQQIDIGKFQNDMTSMKTRDDISIDVIAFDIYDEEANNQLRCAAVATRGKFYSANTKNQLLDSLFESLNIDKNVKGTIKVEEN